MAGLFLFAVAPAHGPGEAAPSTSTTGDRTPQAAPAQPEEDQPTERGPRTTPITFTGPVDPEPAELSAFYGRTVAWAECPDDDLYDCGTVRVPVDYTKPAGATTTIALRRLPASLPAQRIGSLFINPGGPGGSGVDFADEAPYVFGDVVRERYDVIGFDPRGMGESDPVGCLTDAELDAMYAADPTPDTAAEKEAARRAPAERNRRCLARGGALAAHMGTESVARDLDILRSAVGDERLNYYGVSYGTMIGAVYADFFTSRVGHMVLDSGVLPDALAEEAPSREEVDAAARSWADDFDDVVDDFATKCGADCPLGSDTEAVVKTLVGFLDRLDATPLPTGIDTLPTLTEGWARTAIDEGLRDPESWSDLVEALDLAVNQHDGEMLAWLAMGMVERTEDGTYPTTTFGRTHLLVTCSDWPTSPWDSAVPSADVLANHPLWARVQPARPDPCTGWTGTMRETLLVGAEVPTPVLVIGNDGDLTTPIEDTEALAGEIVRSRFVTVEADGHGAYGKGNDCADRVVDDYLARHLAPENGYVCGS